MKQIFLGIGTNLGNREENLHAAMIRISETIGSIVSTSSVYETEPWGFKSTNMFLNMIVEIESSLSPYEILDSIKAIEKEQGRIRTESQYTSRIIDIDILFYGNRILETSDLMVPHPRLQSRKFVLLPMNELSSGFIHPVLMKDMKTLLLETSDETRIIRVFPFEGLN